MSQHIQSIPGFRQNGFNLNCFAILSVELKSEIHFTTVNTRRQGLLSRVAVETLQRLTDRYRAGHLRPNTILKFYVNLAHECVLVEIKTLALKTEKTKRVVPCLQFRREATTPRFFPQITNQYLRLQDRFR